MLIGETPGLLRRRYSRLGADRRRPDPCQCGLVLDAVKAWPGSASASGNGDATASPDGVSTRGQWQIMGRDEETSFSGRTKKQDGSLATERGTPRSTNLWP